MTLVGNIHIVAGGAESVASVLDLLAKDGFETRANPDAFVRQYARFGIDEARELRDRAALRALGTRRVFVIATPSMTTEAQNALLKTFEEPAVTTHFFLIIPSPRALLPTLLSRAQVLSLRRPDSTEGDVEAAAFLSASVPARLDMLKPLLEKDADDKRDLGAVLAFLASLERSLARSQSDPRAVAPVYRAQKYMGDKGALIKPLLEQVALLTPRV